MACASFEIWTLRCILTSISQRIMRLGRGRRLGQVCIQIWQSLRMLGPSVQVAQVLAKAVSIRRLVFTRKTDRYFNRSKGGSSKEKEPQGAWKQRVKYRQMLVSSFIFFYLFSVSIELKNIVPYSKSEDCCFMCKEKLKIERDQCISSGN